jgi:hypothetical protein
MKKEMAEEKWLKLRREMARKEKEWLAIRKREAKAIKANNAEVMWTYAETFDPYGIGPYPLPRTLHQVGREYFARRPGSDVWVWFGDLPDITAKALRKMHGAKLSFPNGLDLSDLPKKASRGKKEARYEI